MPFGVQFLLVDLCYFLNDSLNDSLYFLQQKLKDADITIYIKLHSQITYDLLTDKSKSHALHAPENFLINFLKLQS